jgi:Mg/Co/Ni transporter MgtE
MNEGLSMTLTEDQKKKRAHVLNDLAEAYKDLHKGASTRDAAIEIYEMLTEDPVKLRIINAIAAIEKKGNT